MILDFRRSCILSHSHPAPNRTADTSLAQPRILASRVHAPQEPKTKKEDPQESRLYRGGSFNSRIRNNRQFHGSAAIRVQQRQRKIIPPRSPPTLIITRLRVYDARFAYMSLLCARDSVHKCGAWASTGGSSLFFFCPNPKRERSVFLRRPLCERGKLFFAFNEACRVIQSKCACAAGSFFGVCSFAPNEREHIT